MIVERHPHRQRPRTTQVYGLNPNTGKVIWHNNLGTTSRSRSSDQPCGDIFPIGITGTPAYDAKTGSVFVVDRRQGAAPHVVGAERQERPSALAPQRGPRQESRPQRRAATFRAAGHRQPRHRDVRRTRRRLRQLRGLRHLDRDERQGQDHVLRRTEPRASPACGARQARSRRSTATSYVADRQRLQPHGGKWDQSDGVT